VAGKLDKDGQIPSHRRRLTDCAGSYRETVLSARLVPM